MIVILIVRLNEFVMMRETYVISLKLLRDV